MKAQSLVALDTDHIKDYVFATNTLKEIRGASSLLDRLNRDEMQIVAKSLDEKAVKIYANGGSGLFLIDSNQAEKFGMRIQQEYQRLTAGAASVTYVVQPLPEDAPDTIQEIMKFPMPSTLTLLRHRLRMQKDRPAPYTTEASHPLMRPCDSCGTYYAVQFVSSDRNFCCQSCQLKRAEDGEVKEYITTYIKMETPRKDFKSPLWNEVLGRLEPYNYRLPSETQRPKDLNVFREFRQAKNYLGLIYADANGMGKKIEELSTLQDIQNFAKQIDDAVYWAMCEAINEYLPVKDSDNGFVFPFDILLIGGDDIVVVTPATQAVQVASTLAKNFYAFANKETQQKSDKRATAKHSLSVAVILAPTNYPFSLLLNLAEDTLKFAKKDGSKTIYKQSEYDRTRINFLVVSGNTGQSFDEVYKLLRRKNTDKPLTEFSFYATMRPYTLEGLEYLLKMLQKGHRITLGRSKLQQLREAVLHLDIPTTVTESLAVLRSWKEDARNFVVTEVYRIEKEPLNTENPAISFPTFTFPWLLDKKDAKRYNTPLLDFIELYDFVALEAED